MRTNGSASLRPSALSSPQSDSQSTEYYALEKGALVIRTPASASPKSKFLGALVRSRSNSTDGSQSQSRPSTSGDSTSTGLSASSHRSSRVSDDSKSGSPDGAKNLKLLNKLRSYAETHAILSREGFKDDVGERLNLLDRKCAVLPLEEFGREALQAMRESMAPAELIDSRLGRSIDGVMESWWDRFAQLPQTSAGNCGAADTKSSAPATSERMKALQSQARQLALDSLQGAREACATELALMVRQSQADSGVPPTQAQRNKMADDLLSAIRATLIDTKSANYEQCRTAFEAATRTVLRELVEPWIGRLDAIARTSEGFAAALSELAKGMRTDPTDKAVAKLIDRFATTQPLAHKDLVAQRAAQQLASHLTSYSTMPTGSVAVLQAVSSACELVTSEAVKPNTGDNKGFRVNFIADNIPLDAVRQYPGSHLEVHEGRIVAVPPSHGLAGPALERAARLDRDALEGRTTRSASDEAFMAQRMELGEKHMDEHYKRVAGTYSMKPAAKIEGDRGAAHVEAHTKKMEAKNVAANTKVMEALLDRLGRSEAPPAFIRVVGDAMRLVLKLPPEVFASQLTARLNGVDSGLATSLSVANTKRTELAGQLEKLLADGHLLPTERPYFPQYLDRAVRLWAGRDYEAGINRVTTALKESKAGGLALTGETTSTQGVVEQAVTDLRNVLPKVAEHYPALGEAMVPAQVSSRIVTTSSVHQSIEKHLATLRDSKALLESETPRLGEYTARAARLVMDKVSERQRKGTLASRPVSIEKMTERAIADVRKEQGGEYPSLPLKSNRGLFSR